jgi:hypothetical protein
VIGLALIIARPRDTLGAGEGSTEALLSAIVGAETGERRVRMTVPAWWGGTKAILLREMRFQVDRTRPCRRACRTFPGVRAPTRRAS